MEKRKCSMCGEYKPIDNFRFMKSQSRYNSYCRDCERWYQKHYQREYRRNKDETKGLDRQIWRI